MFPENCSFNDNEIYSLISQTEELVANHANLVSKLSQQDEDAREKLSGQMESLNQQLNANLTRLQAMLNLVEEKIAKIEHDYETVCADMTRLNSDSARRKYEDAVSQLENLHRRNLSIHLLIQNNISKAENAISSAASLNSTENTAPAIKEKQDEKDTAVDSLDNLYDIDIDRSRKDSGLQEQASFQVETVSVRIEQNATVSPVGEQMAPENKTSFEPDTGNTPADIEKIISENSYREQDYNPDCIDSLIDYTESLSGKLADFCESLPPITSENWSDSTAEDLYAARKHYQQDLHYYLGRLYEYLAAAESELRWADHNIAVFNEDTHHNSDSNSAETPDNGLMHLRKEHLNAIDKIRAEIKSMENLIADLDKKSWPYREPKRNCIPTKTDGDIIEADTSADSDNNSTKKENKQLPSGSNSIPVNTGEPKRKIFGGHTEDSAILLYTYQSRHDGGTTDLLYMTDKCISKLLQFSEILPTVDNSGYSECYEAEGLYAKKEKYKLDALQMLGYLNTHLSEVNSEIQRLQFWFENPIVDDDPRYDIDEKKEDLAARITFSKQLREDVIAMIEKNHQAVTASDKKLWPGEKPCGKLDIVDHAQLPPSKAVSSPEDIS